MGDKQKKGYIHVYTGNGKGKTTSTLGLVMRATGAGMKSYVGQFMKDEVYHEIATLKERFPEVTVEQYGNKMGCIIGRDVDEKDIEFAQKGLQQGREAMASGKYDLVVLDEINVATFLGLLKEKDVLDLMANKPENVELVLTGRYAAQSVIDKADLVSEIQEVKHYYQTGVMAREGIER